MTPACACCGSTSAVAYLTVGTVVLCSVCYRTRPDALPRRKEPRR